MVTFIGLGSVNLSIGLWSLVVGEKWGSFTLWKVIMVFCLTTWVGTNSRSISLRPLEPFSFPSYHSKAKRLVSKRFSVKLTKYIAKKSQLVKLQLYYKHPKTYRNIIVMLIILTVKSKLSFMILRFLNILHFFVKLNLLHCFPIACILYRVTFFKDFFFVPSYLLLTNSF